MACGAALVEMLRARGYRVTPQRAVILEEVAHARGHTSARSIHRSASARLPGLNLATVYRTLEALHRAGMVDLMDVGSDRMLFALHDPDGFHGHLLCERCGRMDLMEEKDLVALANHIARRHKFHLDIQHLTLRGLCAQCAATSLEEQEAKPGVF